jgi:uncharacterized membrane protein YedE/YeeE
MELSTATLYLFMIFSLTVIMGYAAQRSQFCPVGGLRDTLNGRSSHRLWTYLAVIAVAIATTTLLEYVNYMDLDNTKPPFRNDQFAWGRYFIGGVIFGIGTALSGCGMRNLVLFGQGSLKALVLITIMAITAYIMTRTSFYADYFMPWLAPMTIDFSHIGSQDLGSLLAASPDNAPTMRLIVGLGIATITILLALRNETFRQPKHLISAIVIGLIITAGYAITGGSFGQQLIEQAEFMDSPPAGLGTQSYSFAGPMGDVVYWLMNIKETNLITFGVVSFIGLALGSLVASVIHNEFNVKLLGSAKDTLISTIGAVLVVVGAVMAMGCTIGHGISGIATLALGSFIALASMTAGAYAVLKLEKRLLQ